MDKKQLTSSSEWCFNSLVWTVVCKDQLSKEMGLVQGFTTQRKELRQHSLRRMGLFPVESVGQSNRAIESSGPPSIQREGLETKADNQQQRKQNKASGSGGRIWKALQRPIGCRWMQTLTGPLWLNWWAGEETLRAVCLFGQYPHYLLPYLSFGQQIFIKLLLWARQWVELDWGSPISLMSSINLNKHIWSFIHTFCKYLLSIFCIPGTVFYTRDKMARSCHIEH